MTTNHSSVIGELRGATKHYGSVIAVDHLDLEVHRGEILALLGPNGAGKTTSINLLLGLAQPTTGAARLFGMAPHKLTARRQIGAMLQDAVFESRARVGECVALHAGYYPMPLNLDVTLRLAGLENLADRTITKLSGGQKQRLAFALAICGNPDLLFLDEPTAGLDVEGRRALWATLRELAGQRRTIVLTTHYLEEADALADRIVVVNQGRVVARGSPAEIKSRAALRHIHCVTELKESRIAALPAVRQVHRDGARLKITTLHAEDVLRELLWQDPELSDLEVTGARLEDAFLALTGKAEKEEAA